MSVGSAMPQALPAGTEVVQCAANVSEGRRTALIAKIAGAAGAVGAAVADVSSDADHNRTVISLLGEPRAVRRAVAAMAERCVALLDLTTHAGVHPRMGVLDVVPLTPIRGAAMETCIALSHEASQDLAALGFQVYLYERSARPGRPCALPAIRGARDLAPDLGPAKRDARIGAVVVGARGPLVAYNIALAEGDVEAARRIAADIRRLRGTDPALRGVRALGLMLATSARAQVSMNITQPDTTGLAGVHAAVRALALQHRAVLGGSEVVGLVPARCLEGADLALLGLNTLRPSQIVESWLVEGPGRPRRDA